MDAWLREAVNPELVEALTFDWMRMSYRLLSLIPLALFGAFEVVVQSWRRWRWRC